MINSFDSLGLNSNLIEGLSIEGIKEPTDIQADAIPFALENRDLIGQSQTGSGKTLAYLLPIFQKINTEKKEMQAIVLAPTHELAMQINDQIKRLSENSKMPVTSAAIIGEVNIKRQIEKLREKPHIIVGSTGRILELIKMRKISAHTIKTIVIDEGDKLLDQHNLSAVKNVVKTTMRDRQLMVFSATISESALNIAKDLMKDPEFVKAEEKATVNENISHMYLACEQRDKIEMLRKLVAAIKPERAIVFINNSEEIEITTAKLQYHHLNACAIYGNASKEERKNALEGFRLGKTQLLIASDVAARGLDVKDVTHIFNLDLPQDSKEYLHRVGRTGRAGKSGTAISIVTEKEMPLIRRYERDFNITIQLKEIYRGQVVDPGMGKSAASNVRKKTFSSKKSGLKKKTSKKSK